MYLRTFKASIAAVLLWVSSFAFAADTQSIVAELYPQALLDKASAEHRTPTKETAFVVLECSAEGAPKLVVAAYSNGIDGAFRVLNIDAAGHAGVVHENTDLLGSNPSIEAIDIDGDGKPEVAAHSTSATGVQSIYLYRWNGTALVDLLPDSQTLDNASLVDLFHNGTMQLVAVDEPRQRPDIDQQITATSTVYELTGGTFVKTKKLLFSDLFVRRKGTPRTEIQRFDAGASNGPFVAYVINGEKNGDHRVSSAQVAVNSVDIAAPRNFNQQVDKIEVALAGMKPSANQITVRLQGEPGARIRVVVEDKSQ